MRYLTDRNAILNSPRLPSTGVTHHLQRAGSEPEISFNDLLRTIRKRAWIVICCVVCTTALAVAAGLLITPKYTSTATVELNPQSNDMFHFDGTSGSNMMPGVEGYEFNVGLATESKIIESDALALRVARELNLEKYPPFAPKDSWLSWLSRLPGMPQKPPVDWNAPLEQMPARRTEFLKTFHNYLVVKPQAGTRMIQVTNKNPDPKLSAEIVNTLLNDYIDMSFRTRYAANSQAADWLSKELMQLRKNYEDAQERVVGYQKENGILALGPEEGHNIVTAKLIEQNTQVDTAEADRIMKEAAYRLSQSGDPEIVSAFAGGPGATGAKDPANLLSSLRNQRASLQGQKAQLLAKFGPAYPRVVEVEQELQNIDESINAETSKVLGRLKAEYQASADSEGMLKSSLEKQKQEAYQLNDRAIQFTVLKHDAEARRDLYDTMAKKLTEAGVLARLRSSNILIVDPAGVPFEPSSPNLKLYLPVAVMAGLFVGVMFTFVAENMDETLTTPEQVEATAQLAAIGTVPRGQSSWLTHIRPPFSSRGPDSPRVWLKPTSEIAESYRALRSSLNAPRLERVPMSIAITSALPHEGKTTTAMNLAATLSQQGVRVLLIEADMRHPSLGRKMELHSSRGLSNVLRGETPVRDCILEYEKVPGLFVLLAGPRPSNPANLLGSKEFRDLLQDLKTEFDTIVIDTPPVLAVTDATAAALVVDYLLLVTRFGVTRRQTLVRARDTLLRGNALVSGVIVNCTDNRSSEYSYYSKRTARYYAEKS